jgi:hypothetical protein
MAIDLKLIDKLLLDYKKPEDIIGENGLLRIVIPLKVALRPQILEITVPQIVEFADNHS